MIARAHRPIRNLSLPARMGTACSSEHNSAAIDASSEVPTASPSSLGPLQTRQHASQSSSAAARPVMGGRLGLDADDHHHLRTELGASQYELVQTALRVADVVSPTVEPVYTFDSRGSIAGEDIPESIKSNLR